MISDFAYANPREDINNWRNDHALLTNTQTHPSPAHRGDKGHLGFNPQIPPTVVLPETAPPTNHVLSFPHDPYPGSSTSGLGSWGTFPDNISQSQQEAAYPSLLPALGRRGEPSRAIDHCHSSTSLSPVVYNPSASSPWTSVSPFSTPVHWENTPIQSGTVHLGMYQASNSTRGHLYSSTSNSSISQSSQYPTTLNSTSCSQPYRLPRAQIDMITAPSVSSPTGQWCSAPIVPSSRQYTPYGVNEVNSDPGLPGILRHHGPTQ